MADTFKFSLYEVFGYLLPGTIALSSVILFDIVAFHHQTNPSLEWMVSKPGIAGGILLAYFSGHAVQILANALLPRSNTAVLKKRCYRTTKTLLDKVRKSPSFEEGSTDEEIIATCESSAIIGASATEREIYVYREGFYRGCTIGLIALGIVAATVLLSHAHRQFARGWGMSTPEIAILMIISFSLGYGMYARSLRFANYRLLLCFTSYLHPCNPPARKTQSRAQLDMSDELGDGSEEGED